MRLNEKGDFEFTDDLKQKIEAAGGIKGEGMNNALRIELLRDYSAERYKLKNGDAFIASEGNQDFGKGRAIPKTYINAKYWDADVKRAEQRVVGADGDAGNSLYNSFKNLVDTQAFEGASGEVFTKQTVDPVKFANLMNSSSKSGDFYFTKNQLITNKNQIRDQWISTNNATLKRGEKEVTREDFTKKVESTIGGKDNILYVIDRIWFLFEIN